MPKNKNKNTNKSPDNKNIKKTQVDESLSQKMNNNNNNNVNIQPFDVPTFQESNEFEEANSNNNEQKEEEIFLTPEEKEEQERQERFNKEVQKLLEQNPHIRFDYVLPLSMKNPMNWTFYTALTAAHSSYWGSQELMLFILGKTCNKK